MPTLRERFEGLISGGQLATLRDQNEQLSAVNERLANAYLDGKYVLPPDQLIQQLAEYYDPQLVDQLIDLMSYEQVGGYGGYDDAERGRAVADATRAYKYSILARYIVNVWTFYALGANVQIVAENDRAQEAWDEFLSARRNKSVLAKDKIDEISRWLLNKGERFFVHYASTQDGEDTIRSIQPEQITRILSDPDDCSQAWFYERRWSEVGTGQQKTMYYADWEVYFSEGIDDRWAMAKRVYDLGGDASRADLAKDGTAVCLQFVPFIQLDEDSLRGWPLLAPHGIPWLRAHREFMQDRKTVSRSVASYTRRYKVAGGTRAVDSVRATLASSFQFGGTAERNPPPVAGSSEVINRAMDAEDLPMRTGAGDAKTDGEMFAWFALLSGGLYPHYAGMGDAYRLATAVSMEKPLEMQFNLYRAQLSAMFREMVEIVLRFKEEFSGAAFDTYAAQVSTDKLVNLDADKITSALSRLWRDVIAPAAMAGDVPDDVLDNLMVTSLQMALEALGQDAPDTLVNLDMFRVPQAQEAAIAEALAESHIGETVSRTCPLCGFPQALHYPDHGPLLVCAGCQKTYDPEVE